MTSLAQKVSTIIPLDRTGMSDEQYYERTIRGRLKLRYWIISHFWRYTAPERFWRRLAFMLPRDLAKWALVRIASGTLLNDEPDKLTYARMADRWEMGIGR